MAPRTLNRRQLRKDVEQAAENAAASTATKAKAPAARKARKPRAKKAPPRMQARWGIFDSGMKQVATFDYNQREAADAKLADLRSKKKSIHFLQIVKEAMPEASPSEELPAGKEP